MFFYKEKTLTKEQSEKIDVLWRHYNEANQLLEHLDKQKKEIMSQIMQIKFDMPDYADKTNTKM